MNSLTGCVLYAVKNSEGKWFRRKGYGGYGDTWVDDFAKARIYNKIGPARGVVSFFANNYSKYPAPSLVALLIDRVEIIDETERIKKSKEKKIRNIQKRVEQNALYRLEEAKKELEIAQKKLHNLTYKN